MSDYSEKLKDPRWQKRRLDVFERDGFKCLGCGDAEATLHVHHLIYSRGDPWYAPMETLETLCYNCHQKREEFNRFLLSVMGIKRSLIPTRFCYIMFRFCDPMHQKGPSDLREYGNRFAEFWKYVGPEQKGTTNETSRNV